jgi:hypothetical protein
MKMKTKDKIELLSAELQNLQSQINRLHEQETTLLSEYREEYLKLHDSVEPERLDETLIRVFRKKDGALDCSIVRPPG